MPGELKVVVTGTWCPRPCGRAFTTRPQHESIPSLDEIWPFSFGKVLDSGLAKAWEADSAEHSLSPSPHLRQSQQAAAVAVPDAESCPCQSTNNASNPSTAARPAATVSTTLPTETGASPSRHSGSCPDSTNRYRTPR